MNTLGTRTFERFADFLKQRLATQQHLTEDSVRYSFFFAALETTDVQQHELILELPHPKLELKEIDTYLLPVGRRAEHFIEFKYHRVSKSSSPKPQKAGALFKDFGRLATVKTDCSRCLVVYLTDSEMATYFNKHREAYSAFWYLPVGGTFLYDETFLAKTRDTVKNVCGEVHQAEIAIAYSAALPDGFHLRIFEVLPHCTLQPSPHAAMLSEA